MANCILLMTWSSEPSVWGTRGQQTLDRLSEVIRTQGAIKCCLGWKAFAWCVFECVFWCTKLKQMDSIPRRTACVSKPRAPVVTSSMNVIIEGR